MSPKKKLRLVGYVRVSEVGGREGPRFISPKVQREQIYGYARLQGHEIVDVLEDLDESGGKWERPGFQEVLRRITEHEVDGVVVAKLDRFARSLPNALRAIDIIDKADGQLVSVAESFDTTTPMGRAMLRISLVFAELQREQIGENWHVARSDAIKRGVHVGKTPVGYHRRPDGIFEPDLDAAPVVREIFLQRAAGASWATLGSYMDEHLPRPDGLSWTRQTVSSLVARRVYLGEAYNGDARNPNAHTRIVSRAEWEAAQVTVPRPRTHVADALLAGILRCAGCGYTMTRASDGKRGYQNYVCVRRHGGGVCPDPSRISTGRADPFVERAFLDRLNKMAQIVVEVRQPSDELDAAINRLETAEAELTAWDQSLLSEIGRDAFLSGRRYRAEAVDAARAELVKLQRENVVQLPRRYELLTEWPTLDTAERRAILAAEIDAVFCRRSASHSRHEPVGDRLHICWRGEGPTDLPGRGRSKLRPFAFGE